MRNAKKQKSMSLTQEREKSIKTVLEEILISHLVEQDFQAAILSFFKELCVKN